MEPRGYHSLTFSGASLDAIACAVHDGHGTDAGKIHMTELIQATSEPVRTFAESLLGAPDLVSPVEEMVFNRTWIVLRTFDFERQRFSEWLVAEIRRAVEEVSRRAFRAYVHGPRLCFVMKAGLVLRLDTMADPFFWEDLVANVPFEHQPLLALVGEETGTLTEAATALALPATEVAYRVQRLRERIHSLSRRPAEGMLVGPASSK